MGSQLGSYSFGQIELDLPTPVSHPPSHECACAATLHTHPKNIFASIKKNQNLVKSLEKIRERVLTKSLLATVSSSNLMFSIVLQTQYLRSF